MTDPRCWLCGVEPDDVIEDHRLGQAEPQQTPVWPTGGDHTHALTPPTPQQLVADGHATYRRIMEDAT
ncbi:hypothetical protein [Micromonospora profundi]|uniref:hypothetical protein n=1 Tax=Micromonospora profundi TaxID=1420889 RepID=UPI003668C1C3